MKNEMEEFESMFREMISSETVPMDEILGYVSGVKGKRLRPMLVLLSARLFGEVNESTRRTALFVEMLHTATLLHDDVVDGSDQRRGQPSVNAQWDSRSAVLAGDFLLAKAMTLLSTPEDHRILKEMLDAAMAMSEGELMQSEELGVRSEEYYLDIIMRKTARLIRACCTGGAMSVMKEKTEDRRQELELMGDFGLHLGLVFQMRDDILDDDNSAITALAKQLLPEYKEKALKALAALTPFVTDQEVFSSLRELTLFCAKRNI